MKDLLVYAEEKQKELFLLKKFQELMDALEENHSQEAYFLVGVAQALYWNSFFERK